MDRVRFGRVLGKGARLAARTAMEAVDAATAASPSQSPQGVAQQLPVRSTPRVAARNATILAPSHLRPAAERAHTSVLAPMRKAGRALWHELTGTFFALFAFSFGVGLWRARANAWSSLPAERHRFAAFCLLALLFIYFSISSFLRARRGSSG